MDRLTENDMGKIDLILRVVDQRIVVCFKVMMWKLARADSSDVLWRETDLKSAWDET